MNLKLMVSSYAGWSVISWDPSVSSPQCWDYRQVYGHNGFFIQVLRDSNSGPHICTASTLTHQTYKTFILLFETGLDYAASGVPDLSG